MNAGEEYAVVRDGDQRLIVARPCARRWPRRWDGSFPWSAPWPGAELVGRRYRPPFDWFQGAAASELDFWRVVAADFVELDAGTGVVHIAPAFGEVDFELLQREQRDQPELPLLCAVRPDGELRSRHRDGGLREAAG